MIDEGVSVSLKTQNHIVARTLLVVHRVFLVPLQESREHAHVCHRLVTSGKGILGQRLVVGQEEVGFGGTRYSVRAPSYRTSI